MTNQDWGIPPSMIRDVEKALREQTPKAIEKKWDGKAVYLVAREAVIAGQRCEVGILQLQTPQKKQVHTVLDSVENAIAHFLTLEVEGAELSIDRLSYTRAVR